MTNENEELNIKSLDETVCRRMANTIDRATNPKNRAVRKIIKPRRTIKKERITQIKRRAEMKESPPKQTKKNKKINGQKRQDKHVKIKQGTN